MTAQRQTQAIHASCVCLNGKALLIRGPSGAGKSTLAMQLIALGATLVSDDRCDLIAQDNALIASAPPAIAGLIEARGLGILRLPFAQNAKVVAAIDLDTAHLPTLRLPQPRSTTVAGIAIDFLHFQQNGHFPSLLMCYLMGTRHA